MGIPFDISQGAHSGSSCLQCHASPRNQPLSGHSAEPWATNFVSVRCTSWHTNATSLGTGGPGCALRPIALWFTCTDDSHTSVAGYQNGTGTCITCHATGNATSPDGGQH